MRHRPFKPFFLNLKAPRQERTPSGNRAEANVGEGASSKGFKDEQYKGRADQQGTSTPEMRGSDFLCLPHPLSSTHQQMKAGDGKGKALIRCGRERKEHTPLLWKGGIWGRCMSGPAREKAAWGVDRFKRNAQKAGGWQDISRTLLPPRRRRCWTKRQELSVCTQSIVREPHTRVTRAPFPRRLLQALNSRETST